MAARTCNLWTRLRQRRCFKRLNTARLPCVPYVLDFQNCKGGIDFVPPSESNRQSNQCKMQEVLIEIIEIVFASESALFSAVFKTNKTNLTQFLATAPPDLISWSNVTSLATCLQNIYLFTCSNSSRCK